MTIGTLTGYLWAAPASLLGLIAATVTGARVHWHDGVLEAHGAGVARAFDLVAPGRAIVAMTLGHVVLARSVAALDDSRLHERVHVRQYETWGVVFLPAYACASAVAWLRGGDAYYDNRFERDAWRQAPIKRVAT